MCFHPSFSGCSAVTQLLQTQQCSNKWQIVLYLVIAHPQKTSSLQLISEDLRFHLLILFPRQKRKGEKKPINEIKPKILHPFKPLQNPEGMLWFKQSHWRFTVTDSQELKLVVKGWVGITCKQPGSRAQQEGAWAQRLLRCRHTILSWN